MAELTEIEFDALREVGNVGVGNAATSLSMLLNKKISIDLPDTKFVRLERFADEIGGPEKIVVALYLQIAGDLNGESIFIFTIEGAHELVDIALGRPTSDAQSLDPDEESAFKEMSNIFTGSYLTALTKMLDMRILPSPPAIATDMAQALIDFLLIKLARSADEILCVKTSIDVEGHNINGKFIIMFDDESLQKVLSALRKQYML